MAKKFRENSKNWPKNRKVWVEKCHENVIQKLVKFNRKKVKSG